MQEETHSEGVKCTSCIRTILPKKSRKGDEGYYKQLNIVEEERCNNIVQNLANKKGEMFFLLPKNHRIFTSRILALLT